MSALTVILFSLSPMRTTNLAATDKSLIQRNKRRRKRGEQELWTGEGDNKNRIREKEEGNEASIQGKQKQRRRTSRDDSALFSFPLTFSVNERVSGG